MLTLTANLTPVHVDVTPNGWRELRTDRTVVDPGTQRELAAAYAELPERDPWAVTLWRDFAAETLAQRAALERQGYRFVVTAHDPYASAASMRRDVLRNRRILVLSTRATGGHPVLSDDDNDSFRGVHDILGHAASGRGFDRHGEEAAWARHARLYSRRARLAMTTETRGQNAALIHSSDGATFASERIAVLPSRWQRTGALATRDRDALAHAEDVHA